MKLDQEYACNWAEEMKYLSSQGIKYTFVKTTDDGITIWKYKKSPKLFKALSDFYCGVYSR